MTAKDLLQNLLPNKQMQFAPVQEDDDELSQSIVNDPAEHDNQWQLTDDTNAEELSAFWDNAIKDLGTLAPEEKEG